MKGLLFSCPVVKWQQVCGGVCNKRISSKSTALWGISRFLSLLFTALLPLSSKRQRKHKAPCSGTTKGLYRHYKSLVQTLQKPCSTTTSGL